MAEEEIKKQAPSRLAARDMAFYRDQGSCVFHHYPLADWASLAGVEADPDNTVEVGLGLSEPEADPNAPVRAVALDLASRRSDDPFVHVIWYPDPGLLEKPRG